MHYVAKNGLRLNQGGVWRRATRCKDTGQVHPAVNYYNSLTIADNVSKFTPSVLLTPRNLIFDVF